MKNLPKNVSQDQLKKLFEHHGKITKVVLPPAKSGQEKSRIGFVHFGERSSAMKALKNTEKYELDGDHCFSFLVCVAFLNTIKVVIPVAWDCFDFRPSFGVFSCKTTGRSKVWRIKFTEVRIASKLSPSCWLWFGRQSLWCSWCRIWCCRFCTGEKCLNVLCHSSMCFCFYQINIYLDDVLQTPCS